MTGSPLFVKFTIITFKVQHNCSANEQNQVDTHEEIVETDLKPEKPVYLSGFGATFRAKGLQTNTNVDYYDANSS
jgi:hypothetical protein